VKREKISLGTRGHGDSYAAEGDVADMGNREKGRAIKRDRSGGNGREAWLIGG